MKKFFYVLLILNFAFASLNTYSQNESPVLVAPENEATDLSLFPALKWQKVGDYEAYEVMLSDDINFEGETPNPTHFDFYVFPKGLDENKIYYWKVRPKNSINPDESWSETRSFTTGSYELDYPKGLKFNFGSPFYLKWDKVADAESYHLQISKDILFEDILIDKSGIDSLDCLVDLEFKSIYYSRIRAENTSGASSWSKIIRIELNLPYIKLESPENRSIKQAVSGKLIWKDFDVVDKYQVILWADNPDNPIISEITEQNEIGYSLEYGTEYYWKVRLFVDQDTSGWGMTWEFRTEYDELPALPEKVALNLPEDGAKAYLGDMFFDELMWNEPPSVVDNYQLQIAKDESFLEKILDEEKEENFYGLREFSIFEGANWIFWRVRAINERGAGPWSDHRSLELDYTDVLDNQITSNISIYPNPLKNNTVIELTLPETSHLEIILIDNLGNHIDIVYNNAIANGENSINYTNENLSNGAYYLIFKYSGIIQAKKIQIIK